MRLLTFSIQFAFLASSVQAQTTNVPKSTQWTVNFAPASCEIFRHRLPDKNGILVELRPHTNYHGLTLIVPPFDGRVFQENVTLSLPIDDPKFPPTAKVGNSPDSANGLIETTVTESQLTAASSNGKVIIEGRRIGRVQVETAGLAKAVAAARGCLDDLAKRWDAPRTWAIDPQAVRDPRKLFQANDYPSVLLVARKTGEARVLVRINATGKVDGCRIVELEGDRLFGERTCQVLAQRGKFVPAKDDNGQAVPGFLLAPPVRWTLW